MLCAALAPAQVTRTETQSVLVDVLVTDKKNKPIHGLTERDFQVFEDGKEQKVDGLFTEAANAAPAQHSLILLFDNAGMTQREQAYARSIAVSMLDQFAAAGASVAVLNFGGALRVAQTFTNDITRAKQAVTRGSGSALGAETGLNDFAVRDLLRSLDGLVTNLQSAGGRKSIVLFSPGYTMTSDFNQLMNQIIGTANRANVSFYGVNTRIVATSSGTPDISAPTPVATVRGRGAAPNTTLTGTPVGMAAANSGLDSPNIASGPALLGFLLKLGESTGGFVVRQPDDAAAIARISKEQSEFYVLSYSPPDTPEGSCHKLRVKVKRDGVNVRAREGYCKRTPGALLSGSTKEKTLEAKALAAQSGNITASIQAPYFYKGTNVARVSAVLEIEPANIVLKKEKNKFVGQLDVVGLANMEDGSAGARFSDIVKLEFDTQAEADAFRKQPYRYENQFDVAPGRYKLAIALGGGGESFAKLEAPLVIEPYTAGQFGVSGLAISHEFHPAGAASSGLDEFLIDDRKKLLADGAEIIPAGSSKLKAAGPAGVFFEVYEPLLAKPDPATPLIVAFQMRVLDRATNTLKADTGGLQIDLRGKQGQSVIPMGVNIPVQTLSPGAYMLEVEVVDTANKSAKRSTPFEIE